MFSDTITETMKTLGVLLGTWKGAGRGSFPTIDAFQYDEEATFTANDAEPLIHYEQRTWDTTNRSDHNEPLHWESGFIRVTETGSIEICNAQNGGRVEVLAGELTARNDGEDAASLLLNSVLIGHDERIRRTRRRYLLSRDDLSYELDMATTRVPELTLHLRAELRRCARC